MGHHDISAGVAGVGGWKYIFMSMDNMYCSAIYTSVGLVLVLIVSLSPLTKKRNNKNKNKTYQSVNCTIIHVVH